MIHLHASVTPSGGGQLDKHLLESVGQWKFQSHLALGQSIVKGLELDDFVNTRFSKNGHAVSLYIGYYKSQKKVGVAHSPLVCMPGQGWEVNRLGNFVFPVGDKEIHANLIEAELHERRNLVIYWYHAYDKSFPGTFKQKVYTTFAKLFHGNEKNAFVRVSLTIMPEDAENLLELMKDFLSHFYPGFVAFMAA